MFILTSPIVTIVVVLVTAFFYAIISGAKHTTFVKQLCLSSSLLALFIGVLGGLSFDKSVAGYQFMSSFSFLKQYNTSLALGVDGLSFVFLLLTLVTFPILFLAA
jgi:NADH:ubiquinone oxidoreductase subunit 4 (subunit M)